MDDVSFRPLPPELSDEYLSRVRSIPVVLSDVSLGARFDYLSRLLEDIIGRLDRIEAALRDRGWMT